MNTMNEPLSLEQLREMDGKPVFIPETNCWALVTKDVFVMLLTFPDGEKCSANDWYTQVGPVYAYPPLQINKEAWTAEWKRQYKSGTDAGTGYVCSKCDMWNNRPAWFCPACGRAMTEEAWKELESAIKKN